MFVSINQLVQELEIPIASLFLTLIELELAGRIEQVGSSQVMLVI